MTYRQEDMPFTASGMVPDLVMNPHALPSRMTIGHLFECIQSKVGACRGTLQTSIAFADLGVDVDERQHTVSSMTRELEKCGFRGNCTERLYNPFTGESMNATIFFGPTFYQRLKHMSAEKVHSRKNGKNDPLTRQPVEGRSRDGGLRLGEMERDGVLAHGAAMFLKDRLLDNSDSFNVPVCRVCGFLASKNAKTKTPFCNYCNSQISAQRGYAVEEGYSSENITVITIPYACKLLVSEMLAMGVRMRFRV